MQLTEVIKKPVITEKSHRLIADGNEYTLVVSNKSNKNLVKEAVEKLFGAKVLRVRIAKVAGKKRRVGRRRVIRETAGLKKAIVKLASGQKIPLFEFEKEK